MDPGFEPRDDLTKFSYYDLNTLRFNLECDRLAPDSGIPSRCQRLAAQRVRWDRVEKGGGWARLALVGSGWVGRWFASWFVTWDALIKQVINVPNIEKFWNNASIWCYFTDFVRNMQPRQKLIGGARRQKDFNTILCLINYKVISAEHNVRWIVTSHTCLKSFAISWRKRVLPVLHVCINL